MVALVFSLGRPADDGAYIRLETQEKPTPAYASVFLRSEVQKRICLGR